MLWRIKLAGELGTRSDPATNQNASVPVHIPLFKQSLVHRFVGDRERDQTRGVGLRFDVFQRWPS